MSSRADIAGANRIVIKVGSSSLTSRDGVLNTERLENIINAIASAKAKGKSIVLVSSGAVAAGYPLLKLAKRPTDLAQQQAAASIGQGLLIAEYAKFAAINNFPVGQVLLSQEDITRRSSYRNAKQTFDSLLQFGVLPIVNENDAVATSELKYGDNDRIAALVTNLIDADALILLTDVPGVLDGPPSNTSSKRIPELESLADFKSLGVDTSQRSQVGSGGMGSKLAAAAIASAGGVPTLICHVDDLPEALAGADVGTLFHASATTSSARALWLAHALVAKGEIHLDDGAIAAILNRGASLLAAGITAITGDFDAGDPVDLISPSGQIIARGLAGFAHEDLAQMKGKSTADLAAQFGADFARPAVHRDNLVLVDPQSNSLQS
jgi:glutamate 5-kinase